MGIADKDYFLDENKQLTDKEDKAAFVLIRKGQEIPKDMADKYGIGKPRNLGAGGAKAANPSANKAAKPAENKSQENKDNEDQ